MWWWRWATLGTLIVAMAGCEEPIPIPVAPPGAAPERIIPPTEAGPPEAIGEIPEKERPQSSPALPTEPKEKKRTPMGVEYETLVAGSGPEVKAGQTITFPYTGWLTNGKKFASSHDF